MNIEKAQNIFTANLNCLPNSFVYYLHERDIFDEKHFYELCDSLKYISTTQINDKICDLSLQAMQLYITISKYFIYHFNPSDDYTMTNCPSNFYDYLEELEFYICKLLS